ncbi:MAG TPA: 2-C-methyl-D-erythritol 4-phosphate cytidylyltransferase, partial [Thermomicrobiales bacterium]|nr:2-C-methyl-D-erythritol 4-phosphate cytidylyltransferase [Thermomicrobiales bacterium]
MHDATDSHSTAPAGTVGAVVVAAGSGTRFGDHEKVFLDLEGRPLLLWSVERLARHTAVQRVVVVLASTRSSAAVRCWVAPVWR